MAKKGHPKNTANKAKHSKLMQQKKNKLKNEKLKRAAKLKEIINRKNTTSKN